MKVAAITGSRACEIVERPDPLVKDNFVKVKISVAPMCTEFKAYKDGARSDVLGHEAAGEVADLARPGLVKPGDRVVVMPQYPCGKCELCLAGDYIHCEHTLDPLQICASQTGTATYAQYCIKQDWLLLPIPDDISTEHAAMACCGLGPTFNAVQRLSAGNFDTVLVVGLGAVGLGAVINASYSGARVIGVESSPYRSALARELGAQQVIDPNDPDALRLLKDLTGGRGADKVIECTAIPAAQSFAIQAARRRGEVAFVGWGGHIELDNMIPNGLSLHGCWHWNLHGVTRMWQTIRANSAKLDRLITHRFPLSKVQEAWELQLSGNCGKVLLDPWG
jgi:threonine dehydrogenase-like Zn-dependent dehydrogenase